MFLEVQHFNETISKLTNDIKLLKKTTKSWNQIFFSKIVIILTSLILII